MQCNYLTLSTVNAKSNAPQRVSAPDWMASSIFSVAWAAYYDDQVYEGRTRSVLHALEIHLHLGDGQALRASTALAAGVALMGETCGAVTAGIISAAILAAMAADMILALKA